MNLQRVNRIFIKLILIASLVIAIAITTISYKKDEWATMASAMTVITAVLAIWTSLNLTWRQEDEKQPQINIYIDDTSHKHAYSLIIKNDGGSPAYNVKLEWTVPLHDYDNKVPRFTDFDNEFDFEHLQNGLQYSRFIMGSDNFQQLVKSSDSPLVYEGIISYTIASNKKYRFKQPFKVSFEPFKKRLNVLNDQMDFYFENKKLASYLKSISESLQQLNTIINDKDNKSSG